MFFQHVFNGDNKIHPTICGNIHIVIIDILIYFILCEMCTLWACYCVAQDALILDAHYISTCLKFSFIISSKL